MMTKFGNNIHIILTHINQNIKWDFFYKRNWTQTGFQADFYMRVGEWPKRKTGDTVYTFDNST